MFGAAGALLAQAPPGALLCLSLHLLLHACHARWPAPAAPRPPPRSALTSPAALPCLPPPRPQAQYLRDLNRSGQHETVIQLFEADRLAATEEVFGQYVRALAKADKLNGTALMQTLYRGAQSYLGHAGSGTAAAARADAAGGSFAASALRPPPFALGGLGGAAEPAAAALGGGAAAAALGSAKNPIYMMQAEPTFWSQLWRRRAAAAAAAVVHARLCDATSGRRRLARSRILAAPPAPPSPPPTLLPLPPSPSLHPAQRAHAGPGLPVHGWPGGHG